jgi:hypothetical protein
MREKVYYEIKLNRILALLSAPKFNCLVVFELILMSTLFCYYNLFNTWTRNLTNLQKLMYNVY